MKAAQVVSGVVQNLARPMPVFGALSALAAAGFAAAGFGDQATGLALFGSVVCGAGEFLSVFRTIHGRPLAHETAVVATALGIALRACVVALVLSAELPRAVLLAAWPCFVGVGLGLMATAYRLRVERMELLSPLTDGMFDATTVRLLVAAPLAFAAAEALLACTLVVDAHSPARGALLGAATLAVALSVGLAARALGPRGMPRQRRAQLEALARRLERDAPEVMLYHSGAPESAYQFRMWLPVLAKLSRRALVLTREPFAIDARETHGVDMVQVRSFAQLFQVLPSSIKVVLYPSNAALNLQMLRWSVPAHHVFVNHGESDKAVNVSFVLGAYSALFVAGQQAIDRFRGQWFELPAERFVIVGRPQTDALAVAELKSGQRTILYAPTWEGWDERDNHSSVESMAERIVQTLLGAFPDARLVYKPHPFTGTRRGSAARASAAVAARLRGGAGHEVVEGTADIAPYLRSADVLVTDVSSVANDFLATGRPLFMTDPQALGREQAGRRFPTVAGAYLVDPEARTLAGDMRDALGPDSMAQARRGVADASLGRLQGHSQAAFDAAITRLCEDVAALRERSNSIK